MEKKEYFSQLISLFEAVSAENVDQFQQNIADTGSDVIDPNVDPKSGSEQPEQETSEEQFANSDNDLNDAAYLTNSASNDAPVESDNREKLVELFDLMEHLLNYAETFIDTIDSTDIFSLEDTDVLKMERYKNSIVSLSEKIRTYLINVFKNRTYEQNLYVYVMLRSELLTAIKLLRNVLKLNEVE